MGQPKMNRRGLFKGLFKDLPKELTSEISRGVEAIRPPAETDAAAVKAPPLTGPSLLPGDAGALHANVAHVAAASARVGSPDGTSVARIQPAACIAYRGSFCSTCVERCPEPGAITVHLGRPTIVSDICTGCGECVERCPAPVTAITVHSRR